MQIKNTSGQGKSAVVPPEIDRWNWGAFLLNWIWGIGNNTFIALLMFVPFVNFVMAFVLGAKGSTWAWQNKRWDNLEQFKTAQRKWARWGVILFALGAASLVPLFFVIGGMLKDSEPYKLAKTQLEQSIEVTTALGKPISTGTPTGNFQVSGPDGQANLQFSVEGPLGKGTAYVEATMQLGRWRLERMAMDEESSGRRIEIKPSN